MTPKEVLRRQQKDKILKLCNRNSLNQKIVTYLQPILSGKNIISYSASQWEPDISAITDLFQANYFYPRIIDKKNRKMEFVQPQSWQIGAYQIAEPIGSQKITAHEADWILLPALGFNQQGFRLGMGAGYYDRCLPAVEDKKKLGILFSHQFLVDFVREVYDTRVSAIITSEGVWDCYA